MLAGTLTENYAKTRHTLEDYVGLQLTVASLANIQIPAVFVSRHGIQRSVL